MTAAILFAVGAAFATRQQQACLYYPQYVPFQGGYTLAGQYGTDYLCYSAYGTCTYYRPTPWSDYVPCRTGFFIRLYR
jgi:hypothetical protein